MKAGKRAYESNEPLRMYLLKTPFGDFGNRQLKRFRIVRHPHGLIINDSFLYYMSGNIIFFSCGFSPFCRLEHQQSRFFQIHSTRIHKQSMLTDTSNMWEITMKLAILLLPFCSAVGIDSLASGDRILSSNLDLLDLSFTLTVFLCQY